MERKQNSEFNHSPALSAENESMNFLTLHARKRNNKLAFCFKLELFLDSAKKLCFQ